MYMVKRSIVEIKLIRGIDGKGLVHSMRLVKLNQSSLNRLSKEIKSYDTELIYSGVIGIQTK